MPKHHNPIDKILQSRGWTFFNKHQLYLQMSHTYEKIGYFIYTCYDFPFVMWIKESRQPVMVPLLDATNPRVVLQALM